jgi:hypothetical protein
MAKILLFLGFMVGLFAQSYCFSQGEKEGDLISLSYDPNLVESAPTPKFKYGHSDKFSREDIKNLIDKGTDILKKIQAGKTFWEIPAKLEIFQDYSQFNNKINIIPKFMSYTVLKEVGVGAYKYALSIFFDDIKSEELRYFWHASLENVVALMWAITHEAFKGQEPFTRGAFSIIDPNDYLYNFLCDYSTFVSEATCLKDLTPAIWNLLGSNLVYDRTTKTSHYEKTTINQVGIDCRFELNGYPLPILPFGMSHIMFGKVFTNMGETKTFLKLEPAGLGDFRSLLEHGMNYFGSISTLDILRREKDIPLDIVAAFSKYLLSLDMDYLDSLLKNLKSVSRYDIVEFFQKYKEGKKYDSNLLDLSAIWYLAEQGTKLEEDSKKADLAKIVVSLVEKKYDLKTISYRTGNEVLMDLSKSSNYIIKKDFELLKEDDLLN